VKRKAIAVFFILLLPLFFYFFLKQGKHFYRHLDYFGPKKVVINIQHPNQPSDTIYHSVFNFILVDPSGDIVSFQKYNPSYWVFHFFNTSCTSPCNDVFTNLYDVVRDFKQAPKVKFLSITTQPLQDSLPVLLKHEKLNGIVPPQWRICTGDSLMIDSLMRNAFFLSGNKTNVALSTLFLVDSDRHLRGIYDGSDILDVRRLKDEIKILSYESKQKTLQQ
jgi:protein SCO1/2